ncbi:helix-turn-helix domain-containing protein [Paenibacillus elgii]
MHYVYIGGMERGERNITLLNLEKIAQALDVELHEFFRFNIPDTEDEEITAAILATIECRSTEDKRRILQIINLIPGGREKESVERTSRTNE